MGAFASELRNWMQASGTSVRGLARRSGYSHGYISELRNGKKRPSPEMARDLDDALGAGGQLAAHVPPSTPAGVVVRQGPDITAALAGIPVPGLGGIVRDADYDRLIEALKDWAEKLKRRDLLAILGAAATAAYAAPATTHSLSDAPKRTMLAVLGEGRADDSVVAHMTSILQHLRLQEDALGPQVVLRTALAQLDVARSLLGSSPSPSVRSKLLSLLANIARFTGWMLFDLNDFKGAEYYYGLARDAAHEADDDATNSMVLANWSHLATWAGDPRLGVEHALGAVAWGQRAESHMLVAYGCDVGARAYSRVVARSGSKHADRARCMASLDQAHQELSQATADDPGEHLAYFYSSALQVSTRIECLLALNDPEPALALVRQSLAGIDPTFVRNMAFARVFAAQAHIQMSDVDAACAELTDAVTLTAGNSSVRLSGMITGTRQNLARWEGSRAVAALDDHIRELTA